MNWRPALIAALLALPLIALFAFGLGTDPRDIPPTIPGKPAPDFTLRIMPPEAEADTSWVRLSDLRSQVVVLNFWASWCVPCRIEHPELVRAARAYGNRGVVFYGILHKDDPESARRWLEEMGGHDYPTLLDPGARVAIDYGLRGVPETVLIDRDGVVAHKWIGQITFDMLAREIEPLLANVTGGE